MQLPVWLQYPKMQLQKKHHGVQSGLWALQSIKLHELKTDGLWWGWGLDCAVLHCVSYLIIWLITPFYTSHCLFLCRHRALSCLLFIPQPYVLSCPAQTPAPTSMDLSPGHRPLSPSSWTEPHRTYCTTTDKKNEKIKWLYQMFWLVLACMLIGAYQIR